MRIIAGKYRGIPVKFPKSDLVRPTTDRNKESIFNILNNRIDFEGIRVLDIYAGSGSLGLEALSRGAAEVCFVEQNFKVSAVLKENIDKVKAQKECKVIISDAVKFTASLSTVNYDLILADPPFFKNDIHLVYKNILNNNFLNEGGIFLIERSIQTREKDVEIFAMEPERRLGDSVIYILRIE
ncbi:MAG: 16S rRNA (guanine(966)-N(2))-methyltransferase RsmD [Melioribacteraceae bacterium]|nr:16S rRNA (guanine(966)-N(2))-methyltransferase RsmD [Melioribacteraceae bacterium]